jgi:endoglucanase
MLVAGGSSSYPGLTALSSAEIYDDSFGRWTAAAAMETPRYGAASAPLRDGRVLVVGGSIGAGALSSAEAFTPPRPPPPVNVSAPAVSITAAGVPGSTAHIGNILSPSRGEWQGDAIQYRYQWQVCRATCDDVGSQLTAQYPPTNLQLNLTPDELGAMVRVVVTASTGPSSRSVASPEIGPVYPAGVHLAATWYPELGISRRSDEPSIPILRDDVSGSQKVGYQVRATSPGGAVFFPTISGVADFSPGQREIDITLPIRDHGVPVLAPGVQMTLSNVSSSEVVFPSRTLAPLYDASAFVRDPANPLAITGRPADPNPLGGATLFADDTDSSAAQWARTMSATDSSAARALQTIANQPNTARFGPWNGPHPGWAVSSYLARATKERPGTVPMLSTYYLVDGHCGRWADPPTTQAAYHAWIKNLAEGIGTRPAVLFLEMDSLITVGCLTKHGQDVRMQELRDAINLLTNVPHLVTYLDAGAADALPARETAHLLRQAGVSQIQGFFLNSTHFDWTSREIRYGQAISRMTRGKHFVVNTAENGRGPLVPRSRVKHGNEVLCDPPGRGLGPLPTWNTGFRNVDAFAWIANPGVSGGRCRPGAPPTGVFWPKLAMELARNADYRVR